MSAMPTSVPRRVIVEGLGLGSVAHDLHNLLASVGFQLGLLDPSEEDVDRIAAAHEAIDRACEITDRLMAISRPMPGERGPVAVGPLIARLADMLRVLIEHRAGLTYVDNAAGQMVMADRIGLERVVTNLVVNARDAVEPGGEIIVRVDPRERDGGASLAITVTENGCGISKAVLDRMFEPYVTTKRTGTGLGLAASLRIVRGWGGDIGVDTQEGEGTTMTVYLPVAAR